MKCDIACCHRPATVAVQFKVLRKSYPYCDYHAYPFRKQRWAHAVSHIIRLSPARSTT